MAQRVHPGGTENWGRFSDRRVDDLCRHQQRALDPAKRRKLVNAAEQVVLENAYFIPGLWWTRNMVHWAKVRDRVAPPNDYSNQRPQDVWLAED